MDPSEDRGGGMLIDGTGAQLLITVYLPIIIMFIMVLI